MFSKLFKKIFKTSNERYVKALLPDVEKINKLEESYQSLTDDQLKAKTQEFMERFQKGESLDDMLFEAFAVVKNACRRLCGTHITYVEQEAEWQMIPYDVQLMGGMTMHRGGIAEMQTGEGKTLTASLPLYLNALSGKNVQLVTTNDFLAKRDSEWIGTIFRYLGLTVGCVQNSQMPDERREQYECNITYGTNSEFGFDYLRDRGMASDKDELVQRDHYFVIVDEIDSILIDEARTPLIISGPVDVSTHRFDKLNKPVEGLIKKQKEFVNKMMMDAKAIVEKADPKSDEYADAIFELCKVKLGMPKNKQLLRLMEDPVIRKATEKQELKFYSDSNRGLLQEVKEELYFSIDEKSHDATLSEKGRTALNPKDATAYVLPDVVTELEAIDADESTDEEKKRELKEAVQQDFDVKNEEVHNIAQLIRAYALYERDVHYIVDEGKVVIVDEHTGYPMPGRRFSEGLHQALEAKEEVKIEKETQTLASITIQNYFRLYDKLAGMTGTAETEATEFKEIYKLDVVAMPTNRPNQRIDLNDRIYKTRKEKYNAIVNEIVEQNQTGRPILVGTPTVEISEVLSRFLKRAKVPHNVLNARRHKDEASIIAAAGQKGAVTIATNMAGRGTDIKLGEGMQELGGLLVIGAERHDSRRIDRQLRGRCARQGDPGQTLFYISLEDDLMRLFGSDRITSVLERLGLEEGEQLESPLLTRTIERAQKRVENQHYSIRKRTLEYDDVMNKQREIIYGRRHSVLLGDNPRQALFDILINTIEDRLQSGATKLDGRTVFNKDDFESWTKITFPTALDFEKVEFDNGTLEQVADACFDVIKTKYLEKSALDGDEDQVKFLEQHIILSAIDKLWKEHLHAMDHLRTGVQFSGVAQKDPLVEYKQQAFRMFNELIDNIANEVVNGMFRSFGSIMALEQLIHGLEGMEMSSASSEQDQELAQLEQFLAQMQAQQGAQFEEQMVGSPEPELEELPEGPEYAFDEEPRPEVTGTLHREQPKVGRNDPCICGSGKKYKKCCGAQG